MKVKTKLPLLLPLNHTNQALKAMKVQFRVCTQLTSSTIAKRKISVIDIDLREFDLLFHSLF